MAEITSIHNDKRDCLQVFNRPLSFDAGAGEEIAFFGLIWTNKPKTSREISNLYQDATYLQINKLTGQEEKIFEETLQKLNSSLQKYASEKNNINLLLGLKCKNKIFFTQRGKIFSLFIDRKSANNTIVSPLGSLLKEADDCFFPHFASGVLLQHQSIFFSTDNISAYFTPVRLATVLFSSPNALWQIKDSVAKLDSVLPFGALHLLYKEKRTATESLTSIENLNATAEQTEKIMAPPILPNFSPILKNFFSIVGEKSVLLGHTLGQLIKNQLQPILARKTSETLVILKNSSKRAPALIKQTSQKTLSCLRQKNWPSLTNYLIEKFNRLQFSAKIMAITLGAVIFLFTQSLIYLWQTGASRQAQALVKNTVQGIQSNLTDAKAALIYGDETRARDLFTAAQTKLDTLNINPIFKNQKQAAASLTTDLNKLKLSLDKVILTQEKELLAFTDRKKPNQLLNFGPDLYLLSDNSLLKFNREKKSLDVVYQNVNLNFKFLALDYSRSIFYLIDPEKNILEQYNTKNKKNEESKIPSLKNWQSVTAYGGRLYVLAGEPTTVYRLTKSGEEFTSALWLKEKIDLSQAVSLTIDGDLYAANKNGQITKMQSGRLKSLSFDALNPALNSANNILTNEDSDYVYLFDQTSKRVIIFSKKGKLLNQYQSVNDYRNFSFDEKNHRLYFLNDTGIFENDLQIVK